MKINNKYIKYLIIAVVVIITFAIIVLLGLWTNSIKTKQHINELRSTLADAISVYGERGLLEMAGIPVNDIYYSDEGLTVLKGEKGSLNYSVDELQNISVYENCSDAVVYINTQLANQTNYLDMNVKNGVGSGFFVSKDGYICTNKHVIEDADIILVTTADGNQYNADLIGFDDENDIAVLKVTSDNGSDFAYLTFDDSDQLIVGQKVLAIGNPFGFDRTLVTGCISGLSRPVRNDTGSILLGMIQTDAPIYPGNSGGPLLNSRGCVVGVSTAVYSQNSTSQGLNFAVSSNVASAIVSDLISYGVVKRGWIDIVPVALTQQIVDYASLKVSSGLLVSEVIADGNAQKAGIKGGSGNPVRYGDKGYFYVGGDVITSVNGYAVSNIGDLYSALSLSRPGDKVDVVINRNGAETKLKVELVERTSALVNKTIK